MKTSLYHETGTKWRAGLPRWWFGAPAIAFVYTLMTPRFLPDLVSIPENSPVRISPAVRWLVGLLIGVAVLTVMQFATWVLTRVKRQSS